jgi:hypothetical protein
MIGFGMGGELVLMGVLWIVGGERVLDMMGLVSLYLHWGLIDLLGGLLPTLEKEVSILSTQGMAKQFS